eukprot:12631.XXX_668105_668482_1 [CDS] Oithona nana genome sequencing.
MSSHIGDNYTFRFGGCTQAFHPFQRVLCRLLTLLQLLDQNLTGMAGQALIQRFLPQWHLRVPLPLLPPQVRHSVPCSHVRPQVRYFVLRPQVRPPVLHSRLRRPQVRLLVQPQVFVSWVTMHACL